MSADGYSTFVPYCTKCGRFVSPASLRPINYRPAAGYNGEVDDGHDSHPSCGEGALVDVKARWVEVTA